MGNANKKERLSDADLDEVLDAYERAGGNGSAAARLLNNTELYTLGVDR